MISALAVDTIFSEDAIYFDFPDRETLRRVAIAYETELARWAYAFRKSKAVLRCPEKHLRISAQLIDVYQGLNQEKEEMADLIYYSGTEGIPPELHELSRRLFDIDGSAGIVRMQDGKQLILNDRANCTLKVASLTDATNWTRSEYYHPADLQEFLRRCQQELVANDPSSAIENTYRAFTPEYGINSEQGWQQITSRYQLFEINGQFYQLGQNLDFQDIARPADLAI